MFDFLCNVALYCTVEAITTVFNARVSFFHGPGALMLQASDVIGMTFLSITVSHGISGAAGLGRVREEKADYK